MSLFSKHSKNSKKMKGKGPRTFEKLHARSLLTAVGFESPVELEEPAAVIVSSDSIDRAESDTDFSMPTSFDSGDGEDNVEEAKGDIREIDWSKTYTPVKDPDLKDPFPDK